MRISSGTHRNFAMPALFATTSKGLHAFTLSGDVTPIGLNDRIVSQATARDGALLAAVPVIHAVHKMMNYVDDDSREQQAGLFEFDVSQGIQADLKGKRVYNGNVKSCAIGKQSTNGKQRWYAGTEPADVVISEDNGKTWADTSSFQAISGRAEWQVVAQWPLGPGITSMLLIVHPASELVTACPACTVLHGSCSICSRSDSMQCPASFIAPCMHP